MSAPMRWERWRALSAHKAGGVSLMASWIAAHAASADARPAVQADQALLAALTPGAQRSATVDVRLVAIPDAVVTMRHADVELVAVVVVRAPALAASGAALVEPVSAAIAIVVDAIGADLDRRAGGWLRAGDVRDVGKPAVARGADPVPPRRVAEEHGVVEVRAVRR